MRVKIIVVAEDHQNGIKSTQEGQIDIPPQLVESANPRDAVKSCAQTGLQHAYRAVGAAIYGQQPQQPPQQPMAPQQPPMPQGPPPQQQPAPQKGLPRTEQEILEQSKGPMRTAIDAERRQPKGPGPGPLGFGADRRR